MAITWPPPPPAPVAQTPMATVTVQGPDGAALEVTPAYVAAQLGFLGAARAAKSLVQMGMEATVAVTSRRA